MFIDLVKNLRMTDLIGGGGGSHFICAFRTQCVRKSICTPPNLFKFCINCTRFQQNFAIQRTKNIKFSYQ